MARYSSSFSSQTAQLSGAPSGTTVNGFAGYLAASATAGYRLRRVLIEILTTTGIVPTSQQFGVQLHRLTVAPAGTGLAAAIAGEAQEIWTPADPTGGLIATTATTIGTTGPTINANPLATLGGNDQVGIDEPWEAYEEIVCNKGTANGIAFVLIGATLPAGHFARITPEWEV